MPTTVIWKVSFSASCIHLAAVLHRGLPMVDARLAALLSTPAEALFHELQLSCDSVDRPLRLLQAFSPAEENNHRLAELVLVKLLGHASVSRSAVGGLAGRLSDLEAALSRERPGLVDELAVRGGPLRGQWDARGPGLLRQIGRLTDVQVVPGTAEVVLVLPCTGGHGDAHWQPGRVTFEGVLTNPHEDLPEILRLAWLISQLNLNLPKFSQWISTDRFPMVASLAMIPPVLAAAESVELTRYDRQMLEQALQAWHLEEFLPAEGADCLHQWWSTWEEQSTAWPVALAALDQMLAA